MRRRGFWLTIALALVLMGIRQVQAWLTPRWRPVRSGKEAVARVREQQSLAPAGAVGWRGGKICRTHPPGEGFDGYLIHVMPRDENGQLYSCQWVYVDPKTGHASRVGCYMGETRRGCKPVE